MYEQVNDPQLPQEGTHHESPIVEKDASKEQSAIEKDQNEVRQQEPQKTHYLPHPMALLFPPKPNEEREELKVNMIERVNKGLDPLESPILLLNDQIVDGIHRSEIWLELAAENACDGYFTKTNPRFETCKDGDELALWLRVQSRNLVQRQLPAEQRAAIFLKLIDQFPEIKNVLDEIQRKNRERQATGQPLVAGDQRGNTNQVDAEMAGVGETTVKVVKKMKKEDPKEFEKLAQGKTTAKKALAKTKTSEPSKVGGSSSVSPKSNKDNPAPDEAKLLADTKVGDKVFTIRKYTFGEGDLYLIKRIVKKIEGHRFHFEDGQSAVQIYDRKGATCRRQILLETEIESLSEEIKMLRKALKGPAKISPDQTYQSGTSQRSSPRDDQGTRPARQHPDATTDVDHRHSTRR